MLLILYLILFDCSGHLTVDFGVFKGPYNRKHNDYALSLPSIYNFFRCDGFAFGGKFLFVAEVIRRAPVNTSTPWFPQGEKGMFVNVGMERWKRRIEDWRSDGNEEPSELYEELMCRVKKMSSKSVAEVIDVISSTVNVRKSLPEPINLDEVRNRIHYNF